MGLDLSFSKKAVIEAGAKLIKSTNGTKEEIADAIACKDTPSYIEWLKEEITLLQVPNTTTCVLVSSHGDEMSCRANHWGTTYHILTPWLSANNISWQEF
jgi:hypothetical protein